jgi:5-methylthioribose kinase
MGYMELDAQSVISYLLEIPSVMEYFDGDELLAKEIGDGNLNFVYLISSKVDAQKALNKIRSSYRFYS